MATGLRWAPANLEIQVDEEGRLCDLLALVRCCTINHHSHHCQVGIWWSRVVSKVQSSYFIPLVRKYYSFTMVNPRHVLGIAVFRPLLWHRFVYVSAAVDIAKVSASRKREEDQQKEMEDVHQYKKKLLINCICDHMHFEDLLRKDDKSNEEEIYSQLFKLLYPG